MSAPVTQITEALPPQHFSHWPSWPAPWPVPLHISAAHDCPYLAEHTAVTRAFLTRRMPPAIYQAFMDAGFRRSGEVFYQPACPHCRSCVPLRVPVARFAPRQSQRRCYRRNQDLKVTFGKPAADREKYALYVRYLEARHDGLQSREWDHLVEFLYTSPTATLEFTYRTGEGRLLGVGIGDVTEAAFSTVYFFFDPDERRRSLGTFSSLVEIDWCRRHHRPYYYLGYWIEACPRMSYKNQYRPCEYLGTDAVWREWGAEG